MPLPYAVVVALQALCLLHALKHRAEQRWYYLIVFMPGLGCAVYLLAEVLPRLRAHGAGVAVPLPFFQRRRLARLEADLRFSETVENRLALAAAYAEAGRNDDALATCEPCLAGPSRKDGHLALRVASAALAARRAERALEIVATIDAERGELAKAARLMRARCLDALARDAEAEEAYVAAMKGFDGEEARGRFIEFLWTRGRRGDACAIARELVDYARINDREYRRRERAWIATAKRRLREAAREATKAHVAA